MNRAQQAYYLERNGFAGNADFGSLGLGVATETTNYSYAIQPAASDTAVVNYANTVAPSAPLKTYIGGVNVGSIEATSEATTLAVLCEGKAAMSNGGVQGSAGVVTFSPTEAPTCSGNHVPLN